MNYQEIKEKEGTGIAINQALIDCLNGKITGGDFLDELNDLHPILELVSNENIEDDFKRVAREVEKEFGMGGLSGGIYEEFAREVYNRFIKK